ncbi:MAG TPA: ABC transporter substrate-binding protein [Alphaproteobacteria bacterium]
MRLSSLIGAALCGVCLLQGVVAHAADKITGGAIGSASGTLWPYYIALSKGFFLEQNIDLDLVFAPSSAAVMQQLAAGALDVVATSGLADPIHAIDKGAPVAILRVSGRSVPYELMAKPEIKSIRELKGKTISLGGIADITRIYFDRMAAPNGVEPGQYDMVFAGATSARFSALRSGAVDAALILPPFNFLARSAGFNSLGLALDYTKDMPFIGIHVSRAWAGTHKPVLQRFVAAYGKGVDWFYDDAHREEAISIYGRASNANRNEITESYDFFRKIEFFERSDKISRAGLQNLLDAMKQLGDVDKSLTVDRLVLPDLTVLTD